jgi:hypothetical protein
MKLDKQKMIYAGVGIFVFLVLVSSTKKIVLQEVSTNTPTKSFNSTSLPHELRPPYKLAEGEDLPKSMAKRSFNLFGLKPRFDT